MFARLYAITKPALNFNGSFAEAIEVNITTMDFTNLAPPSCAGSFEAIHDQLPTA